MLISRYFWAFFDKFASLPCTQEDKEDALYELKRAKDQELEMVLADKQSMMMRGEREREELQNELDKTRTNLRYNTACIEVSC